jgi:MFS family permease
VTLNPPAESIGTPVSTKRRRLGFSEIPRKVRWIIYVNAAGGFNFGYLMIFITAYYLEIGIGAGRIGLILGVEGAAMVTFAVPLGLYSDRHGRKVPLLAASAVLPLIALVFAFTTEISWLLLAAVVVGIAEGGILATWNAMIADQTTPAQRDAAFSLSFVLGSVASGVGLALPITFPFLGSLTGLDSHTIHVATFVVTDAFAFLIPIALVFLLRGYRENLRPREARPKGMDWKPLLKFSGLNGLIGLGAGFFIPLVPTWLHLKFGISDSLSGPVLALANITIGLSAVASAALARRFGPVRAIVLATGSATTFLFSLAFLTNPIAAAGFYIVRAALMNMSSPIADSFLMGIVSPEQRGLASAVNSIIWRLPNSVTTVFGGQLMDAGLLDVPIFLATVFYAAFVMGFYAVFRKVSPST